MLFFLSFFVALSFVAVFYRASAFNSDVSKWNTSAVTTMESSKSTLTLPVAMPSVVVFFNTTARVSSDYILTRFVILFVFVEKWVLFVIDVGYFFLLCCVLFYCSV